MAIVRFVLVAIAILSGSRNNAAASYLELENLGSGCFQEVVQGCTSRYDGDGNAHIANETNRAGCAALPGGEAFVGARPFLDRLEGDATRGAATAGLRGRQLASEMTGNRIQRMAKAMREGTFDWKAAGPVRIAERDGTRIILDGHHRVAAARRAGLSEVPATVEQVSDGVWNTLVRQAAEALGR